MCGGGHRSVFPLLQMLADVLPKRKQVFKAVVCSIVCVPMPWSPGLHTYYPYIPRNEAYATLWCDVLAQQ